MKHIDEIFRSIEFIDSNLQEELSVQKAADAAGYSLFHFSRIFNQLTRHSPYDYIMRRRLSEACRRLFKTDIKVIDLAFDYQFNNPETFSRAFRKMFGILPKDARKGFQLEDFILKDAITSEYLQYINLINIFQPEIVELDAVDINGVSYYTKISPIDEKELFAKIYSLYRENNEDDNNQIIKLQIYPAKNRKGGYFSLLGNKSGSDGKASELFVNKRISAAKYLKFKFTGKFEERSLFLVYIMQTYIPKTEYCLCNNYELEYMTGNVSGTYESEIYIPVEQVS